jgi:tetratricopeptide (TPR) repeat protein
MMTPRRWIVWAIFGMMASGAGLSVDARSQQAPPPTIAPAQSPRRQTPTPEQLAAVRAFQTRVERAAQALGLDTLRALESLDTLAVESAELRKVRPLNPAERPVHRQLFIARARGYLKAGNTDKADECYRELLRVDPFFVASLPVRERERLDSVNARERGSIDVTSHVKDCRVILDGVGIGTTGEAPVHVTLVAGSYQLRLEKDGFQAATARITIGAGQTLAVGDLAPRSAVPLVLLLTDRPGLTVTIDQSPAGDTQRLADLKSSLSPDEASAVDLAATAAVFDPATSGGLIIRDATLDRPFTVQLRGACVVDQTRSLTVTADAVAGLAPGSALLWLGEASAFRMPSDVGTLRVTSVPADAEVYVDGALQGRTPFEQQVCTGQHRIRVRHPAGSSQITTAIVRGRAESIDVALKPGLAFLGAIETTPGGLRPFGELSAALERSLESTLHRFTLAHPVDARAGAAAWTDQLTADLIAAADRADSAAIARLLLVAKQHWDTPLLLAAVVRGSAGGEIGPIDLMLFWQGRADIDRMQVAGIATNVLRPAFERIDRSGDTDALLYEQSLGLQVADTGLAEAPLLVVSVEAGGPAAAAGLKPGDSLVALDGSTVTARQFADALSQKKTGQTLVATFSPVAGDGTSKQAPLTAQRRPRRAPLSDETLASNGIVAALTATAAGATSQADRDLAGFNLALTHMRLGEWSRALELFSAPGPLPAGIGVGPGAALYFRARCHEQLGDKDRALALYREAAAVNGQVLADDGASVAMLAKLRLAALGDARTTPAVIK